MSEPHRHTEVAPAAAGDTPALTTEVQSAESAAAAARDSATAPLLDDYDIERELGRGGMGVVRLARPRAGGPPVAVKTLSDALAADAQAVARFRTEGDALARLRHPNVVALLAIVAGPGGPSLVQEYVPGGTLKDCLAGRPLAPADAAELVVLLAGAVHHAHEHGVLHRDLKPGNVLLGKAPDPAAPAPPAALEPKVTDFGLARLTDAEFQQTATGDVLGTPAYMAPEQARGDTHGIGRPTDVYALGVILFECLTGRTPFGGENRMQVLNAVQHDDPPAPSKLLPGVPRDLDVICLKCLHKDANKRYATAAELADDLRRFREDRPIRARPVGLAERTAKWRRRHPTTSALGAAAVLLLLLVAAAGAWYWDSRLRVKTEHFVGVTWRRGAAEGVGKLTATDAGRRALVYRVTRRGRRVLSVETVNGSGRPTSADADIGLPQPATDLASVPPTRYEFQYAESGEVRTVAASDRHGNLLWALVFTAPDRAQFTDPAGRPLDRTASGITGLGFDWSADGRAAEVRFLDRAGRPKADDAGISGARLEHDAAGRVTRLTHLGRDGKPGWHRARRFTTLARAYDAAGNRTEERYEGPDGKPVADARTWLSRIEFGYDANGNPTAERYFGPDGKLAFGRDGYTRAALTFDGRGNQVEEAYFGPDDRPVPSKDGYHRVAFECDARGNRTGERYFDAAGHPTPNKSGVARVARTFDGGDNPTAEVYFDAADKPAPSADGYAHRAMTYDARGYQTGEAYFDAAGGPTEGPDAVAGWVRTNTDRGRPLEGHGYGRDGAVVYGKNGIARWRNAYDDSGRLTEDAGYAPDGAPVLGADGYARRVLSYDEQGFQTGVAYFGVAGEPVAGPNRLARAAYMRDEFGRRVAEEYFDAEGKPTPFGEDTYVRLTIEYDAAGNRVRETYFGPDGKPGLNKEGYARADYTFNEYGWTTEERYSDADGRPVMRRGAFARLVMRYDDRGNRVEEAYYGPDGAAVIQPEGHTRLVDEFDARGLNTRRSYFGAAGRPVRYKGKEASYVQTFDHAGRVVESRYFGPDGEPTVSAANGHVVFRLTYNARGDVIEQASFGADGQPMLTTGGYASLRSVYLPNGINTEESYHGLNGELVACEDGWARVEYRQNERRQPVEIAYFGPDGKPVAGPDGFARVIQKHDRFGRVVEEQNFGPDGRPCRNKRGYSRFYNTYDERGRLTEIGGDHTPGVFVRHKVGAHGKPTETAYSDPATGRPVTGPDGFATAHIQYDARGNQVGSQMFGPDGKPAFNKEGFSRIVTAFDAAGRKVGETGTRPDGLWKLSYNPRGQVTRLELLTFDGKPRAGPDGVCVTESRYDTAGNQIEVRYAGPDGLPCTGQDGFARVEYRYDDGGREIERRHFGPDDRPVDKSTGYHRSVQRFDAAGRQLEMARYKADGSPAPLADGSYRATFVYAADGKPLETTLYRVGVRVRQRYDAAGRVADSEFQNHDGTPQVQPDGFTRETRSYDAAGRFNAAAYFGPDGKPVMVNGKFARFEETLDAKGKRTGRAEYDTAGKLLRRLRYSDAGVETGRSEFVGGGELRFKNDAKGHPAEAAFFDADGKPAVHPEGYARLTATADDKGRLTRVAYFGPDGQPALVGGVSEKRTEYAPDGRPRARTLVTATGGVRAEFDAKDRIVETALFDLALKPIVGKDGWHAQKTEYDGDSPKARSYLDVNRKPVAVRAVVESVEPKSTAAELGIKTGDVLVEYDGRPIGQALEFTRRRTGEKDGERKLVVRRGGESLTFTVRPGVLGVVLTDRAGTDVK